MDPNPLPAASAAASPYNAPPPQSHSNLSSQPMPFDNVYGQQYEGYDTRSTIPLSGSQPALAEPEAFRNVYNPRHAGYDTRSTVPLGSQAYMNGNYSVQAPDGGMYNGRYAGLSTKSSLTLAHFGGNDSGNAKQAMYQTTSKSTYTPPSHPLLRSRAVEGPCAPVEPNPFITRPAYPVGRGASPRESGQARHLVEAPQGYTGSQARPTLADDSVGAGVGTAPPLGSGRGGAMATGLGSPSASGQNGGSLKLPPISQEQAEALIREVARLRVENRELTERLKACTCTASQGAGF